MIENLMVRALKVRLSMQGTPQTGNSWNEGAVHLEYLLKELGPQFGVTNADIDQFRGVPLRRAVTQLREITARPQEARQRVSFCLCLARAADTPKSFRPAVQTAAFTFFRLHLIRPGPSRDYAMVWAELALQLGEAAGGNKRQPWMINVRQFYERCFAAGEVPAWQQALRINPKEARDRLLAIRRALGSGAFHFPTPPRPVRKSRPIPGPDLAAHDIASPREPQRSFTRISKVRITDFRGIAGTVEIDFLDAGGHAQSVLITGDNGVGKSTIVSAIEFACQARIGRRSEYVSPSSPHAINLSAGAVTANVEVTLGDGRKIERRLVERENGPRQVGPSPPLDEFALAPMSLQRSDIVKFLATRPEERGLIFTDHFSSDHTEDIALSGEAEVVRHELAELKKERRDLIQSIADKHSLPAGLPPLQLVQQAYFGGLSKRQYEDRHGRPAPSEGVRKGTLVIELNTKIKNAKKRVELASPGSSPGLYEQRVRRLAALLGDIDNPLTAAFQSVTGIHWISAIRVIFGRISALSIELEVQLENGHSSPPERIFSEGYQDLIALLFFLEVAQAAARRGQAQVLILDDVLQSVDATVRVALFSYALTRLSGWQIFFTVHDLLWKAQVADLLRQHGFATVEREIRRWSLTAGPTLASSNHRETTGLNDALERGSSASICAEAGRLLERISDKMSYLLPVSVIRRQGDRYTLGDLWPAVLKKLRKTSLQSEVEAVETWFHLRNLVGAHYNEWAENLPLTDAEQFGEATLHLFASLYCERCRQWVRKSPQDSTWVCRCGAVIVGAPEE